jgi:hypothetical protein
MDKLSQIFSTKLKEIQEKAEIILASEIVIQKSTIYEMAEKLHISWINPLVTDKNYPLFDSFLGKWNVEVLRLNRKMKFQDIVSMIHIDGWQPANIYHLLYLMITPDGNGLSRSLIAPGSIYIDDFECPGCVVLSVNKEDKKIGLGNWRNSKICGYDIVRVKQKQ